MWFDARECLHMFRNRFTLFFLVASPLLFPNAGRACIGCGAGDMGKPLTIQGREADWIGLGILHEPRLVDIGLHWTDFTVQKVIKEHPLLAEKVATKKLVTLNRYTMGNPTPDGKPLPTIILADVVDGQLDPIQVIPVTSQHTTQYVRDVIQINRATTKEKLAFAFRYLQHDDPTISQDAFRVFALATFVEVESASVSYQADWLRARLRDPRTPSYYMGLYGCLLGVCGNASDAPLLLDIIENRKPRLLVGMDGILAGYCLLKPQSGPSYVLNVLANPKTPSSTRYAAVRTARFLLTEKKLLPKNEVCHGMETALERDDVTDLLLEELRLQQYWEALPTILRLQPLADYSAIQIQRACLRFALQCPDPRARVFIDNQRRASPEVVTQMEDNLRAEARLKSASKEPTP